MPGKQKTASTKVENPNPYLAGRREWNERYGSYIAQNRTWKAIAFASLIVTAISVIGIAYIGSQSKFVPYLVEVDKLGQPAAVGRVAQVNNADPRIIKSMLANFIVNVRSVMADVSAQRRAIHNAYAMLRNGDASMMMVNGYFQGQANPFKRATSVIVTVEINSVLPISESGWQIDWTETNTSRNGERMSVDRYRANIIIAVVPPEEEAAILINPIGLYVKELSWAKQL